jgi:hypothetical protein
MFSFIHKWHKKLGVCSAVFVIFLASSGILLNHSQQFHLNSNHVQIEWLLDLYQIKPTNDPIAYSVNNAWASQIGERLYFNEHEIATDIKELKGIIKINDLYVVAYDGQLTLLTTKEEIVENLSGAAGVPAGMQAIGYDDQNNVIIKAAHGYYQVNIDELKWEEFDYLDAVWSESSLLPETLENKLLEKYRGSGLTLERVLLDFHSGRIAGQWGVYVVDMMAILFLLLAFSGVWMWWKRK